MAITNSIGAFNAPGLYDANANTAKKADFLQTSGSAATTTVYVFAKESASDTLFLTFISVDIIAPTSNAEHVVYVATSTVLGQMPTGTAYSRSWTFGWPGLRIGNTDTYSAYIQSAVAGTATVRFVAQGYRYK